MVSIHQHHTSGRCSIREKVIIEVRGWKNRRLRVTLQPSSRIDKGKAAHSSQVDESRANFLPCLSLVLLLVLLPVVAAANEDHEICWKRSDAEILFIDGLKAFRAAADPGSPSESFEESVRLLEKAVECDREHGSALFWLGLAYFHQGDHSNAARSIKRALRADQPPRAERNKVRSVLEAVRVGRRAGFTGRELPTAPNYQGPFWPTSKHWSWTGRLGVATALDSNPLHVADDSLFVRSSDVDQDTDTQPFEFAPNEDAEQVLDLDLRLGLFRMRPEDDRRKARGGWSLGLTFEGHRSLHSSLRALDLDQGRMTAHLAWGRDPLSSLDGPFGYTSVPYGAGRFAAVLQASFALNRLGGVNYSQSGSLGLAATFRQSRATETRLELLYQAPDFVHAFEIGGLKLDSGQGSGKRQSADVSQFFYLKRRERFLRLGALIGRRTGGERIERDFAAAYLQVGLPFGPHLRSSWSVYAARDNFKFDRDYSGIPREDTTFDASASISWSMTSRLEMFLHISHSYRESNLTLRFEEFDYLRPELLNYERSRAALGLRILFGGAS